MRANERPAYGAFFGYQLSEQMAGHLDCVVVSSGPFLIFNNFQRELSDGPRVLNCEVSAILGYQRLKSFEFAAPDRFHVPIPACVACFGRISDAYRSTCKTSDCDPPESSTPYPGLAAFPKNDATTH